MSACPPLSFSNVDAAAWGRVKAMAAKEYGVTVSSNTDAVSAAGFTIEWDYNTGLDLLTVQCLVSPFLVPCETINTHLTAAVNGALAAT